MLELDSTPDDPDNQLSDRMLDAAEAVRRVIIRKGLEATTLRDIAREGGFTTGVLTHHFVDKRDLIVAAFAETSRGWLAWARQELGDATTVDELIAAFLRLGVPADEERRAEWRLWAEMWIYAGRDREFAEQVETTDAQWTEMMRGFLQRCRDAGRLRPGVNIELEAEILNRLMDGLGMRAWLSHDWDSPRACLEQHLRTLGLEQQVAGTPARAD